MGVIMWRRLVDGHKDCHLYSNSSLELSICSNVCTIIVCRTVTQAYYSIWKQKKTVQIEIPWNYKPLIYSAVKKQMLKLFSLHCIYYINTQYSIILKGSGFMAKQIRYTLEYKMKTVQLYLQGDMSANQLALNLGVHPHTVRHWIQEYNDGKLKMEPPFERERPGVPIGTAGGQKETSKKPDIGIIISKIGVLESELKDLKAMIQKFSIEW